MDHAVFFVKDMEGLRPMVESLTDGWVPDPVLMPTGRPNIIEGIGAVYHLVKGTDQEVGEYAYNTSPEFTLDEIKKELQEKTEAAPEFVGVVGTLSLEHGEVPPMGDGVGKSGEWSIFKVYEKKVIWIHRATKEAIVQ